MFDAVIVPGAKSAPIIVPSRIFPVVTASEASLGLVTLPSAKSTV